MSFTAKLTPYSSVVGQGVTIFDERGQIAAQIAILVPDPGRNYKETANAVAKQIMIGFLSGKERLDNLKRAFAENNIPARQLMPTSHAHEMAHCETIIANATAQADDRHPPRRR